MEHEAVEALPPLDVVHQGDLLPVGALEDGLGALDVVHHELAGGELGLVESSAGSFVCRNMSCAHHHNWKCLSGTAATLGQQKEATRTNRRNRTKFFSSPDFVKSRLGMTSKHKQGS